MYIGWFSLSSDKFNYVHSMTASLLLDGLSLYTLLPREDINISTR